MKRVVLLLVAAALAAAGSSAAGVPRVQAEAYVVQNAATGEVLLAHDERERRPIASITKLMTVLVALDHARLDDVVTVSPVSASVGESTIHLQPGERITVRDLARAALVQSANDAANALALHVGGSVGAFVRLMNEKAAELGLRDTRFANPTGLDAPGAYSTAADVTKLGRIAMRTRFIRETVRLRTATLENGRRLFTWNDLLSSFPRLLGVKTGHTDGAGWSQVAAARGGGVTIYATLLGGETREGRNGDLAELLAWGLSRYRVVHAVDGDRVYARAATGYGRAPVALVAPRALARVVRVDRPLVERVVAPSAVELPVRAGQRLGEVQVFAGEKLLARSPLVAARAVERPGLGEKLSWYAGRTLHHLGGLFS